MTVRMALHYYWSQRLWPVSYQWAPHLKLLGYGIAVVLPTFLLVPNRLAPQIAAGTALLGVYALLTWTTVLHAQDRNTLLALLKSPRDFGKLLAGS
jgi:hypothetical protein